MAIETWYCASTAVVNGVLSQESGQLQFLWNMELQAEKTSGVSAVLWKSPPPEIAEEHHHEQMEMHQHHKSVKIPNTCLPNCNQFPRT